VGRHRPSPSKRLSEFNAGARRWQWSTRPRW
jgi:hypothetical protein